MYYTNIAISVRCVMDFGSEDVELAAQATVRWRRGTLLKACTILMIKASSSIHQKLHHSRLWMPIYLTNALHLE